MSDNNPTSTSTPAPTPLFNLQIDQEAINKEVVRAVIDSSIGKQVQKAVDDFVNKFNSTYDFKRHIEDAVQTAISQAIYAEIGKNEDKIRAFVEQHLTEEILERTIRKMWEKWERGW